MEFPLIHQVASKVLHNKIGRQVGYCWNTGAPFQEERSPQVSTMCCIYPPQITFFKASQTKQIARPGKKTSSQQPPEFCSFPSFPHLDHRHIIKNSSLELSMMRWASRVTTGHRSHMDEVVLPGFQLSRKLVPPTSWKCYGNLRYPPQSYPPEK